MTNLETLMQEKTSLEEKIRGDQALIEACTTSIYWNKKRIKLIDSQIKALPVEPEKTNTE